MFQRIIHKSIKKSFPVFQSLGLHVTRNHFYEPIPDTRTLKKALWSRDRFLQGVNYQEKKQLALLATFSKKYKDEYGKFSLKNNNDGYYVNNGMFESVDGEVLYSMVRHFRPKQVIEAGSGFTTLLIDHALSENKSGQLTIIDPFPEEIYKYPNIRKHKIIKKKIEDVPLSVFEKLNENDILFIDSSHVVKIGNDVQYEFMEILPRLKKGVIVHIHDIFLPSEYPKRAVLNDFVFWSEQYMLHAFLQYNESFEVLWGGSFMHLFHSKELEKAFSSYSAKTNWPGSFWIRKIK
jgi:predicted O-methyltransferase YrrM